MYNHISQMEPPYPARSESLEDLARKESPRLPS